MPTKSAERAIEIKKSTKIRKKPKSTYRRFWKATFISTMLLMAELWTPVKHFF